ncbi:conserved hypothetical protein [Ahrensia sp. R2A130]|nr:conserved hypothetical protein [Ahrensia sp. R2A130]
MWLCKSCAPFSNWKVRALRYLVISTSFATAPARIHAWAQLGFGVV